MMHSSDKDHGQPSPPRTRTINTFFHIPGWAEKDFSSAACLPLALQTGHRLHLCFHYTALFSFAELKLCLAVCHHSVLLPQQPDRVNRLLCLILCSVGSYTVMLRKLVDSGNSWQPSQILNIKILQAELEINTNHQCVVIKCFRIVCMSVTLTSLAVVSVLYTSIKKARLTSETIKQVCIFVSLCDHFIHPSDLSSADSITTFDLFHIFYCSFSAAWQYNCLSH